MNDICHRLHIKGKARRYKIKKHLEILYGLEYKEILQVVRIPTLSVASVISTV